MSNTLQRIKDKGEECVSPCNQNETREIIFVVSKEGVNCKFQFLLPLVGQILQEYAAEINKNGRIFL